MYSRVVPYLRCPICRGGLAEAPAGTGRALACAGGHSFDLAKQGYANLACPAPTNSGDSAQMVEARIQFLGTGHYRFIAQAVASVAASLCDPHAEALIVEAGAGTGYYVSAVLDALPGYSAIALDVSKAALRRVSKAHPRCGAALCDVWRELPLADGVAGLVLSVFAPRNSSEFRRVLAANGALVIVTPTSAHLAELVGALDLLSVDPNKDEAVAASLRDQFILVGHKRHEVSLQLSHREVAALVGMGPSAWHMDAAKFAARIDTLPEIVTATASVQVSSYRVRPEG